MLVLTYSEILRSMSNTEGLKQKVVFDPRYLSHLESGCSVHTGSSGHTRHAAESLLSSDAGHSHGSVLTGQTVLSGRTREARLAWNRKGS